MPVVLEIIEPNIALLQVNRPSVRNALNWEAMQAFADCVERAHALPDLRALIVSGAGDAFIAGGDLKELHTYPSHGDGQSLSRRMVMALQRLEALPYPVIAAINGPARGGALVDRHLWGGETSGDGRRHHDSRAVVGVLLEVASCLRRQRLGEQQVRLQVDDSTCNTQRPASFHVEVA